MIKKVVRKQINTEYCFVCGKNNEHGFEADFYEMDDGSLIVLCQAKWFHQSFTNTIHGGISTALIDEAVNRAIQCSEPDTLGVTVELSSKLLHPVPYDVPLIVSAHITENSTKVYKGDAEIILPDGTVAATGSAVCVKLRGEKLEMAIAATNAVPAELTADDPTEIELPDCVAAASPVKVQAPAPKG